MGERDKTNPVVPGFRYCRVARRLSPTGWLALPLSFIRDKQPAYTYPVRWQQVAPLNLISA